MKNVRKIINVLTVLLAPSYCWSITLAELHKIDAVHRAWYLGGIYDANIIQWNKDGQRSKCIEALGYQGFIKKISNFVEELPQDANTKERRVYDSMNVALLAVLVISQECTK